MDDIFQHISGNPDAKYLAIQNKLVLGCYDTYEQAEARIKTEIERDRLKILLKHKLLKKILKKHNGFLTDYYLITEVKAYEIPKLFQ